MRMPSPAARRPGTTRTRRRGRQARRHRRSPPRAAHPAAAVAAVFGQCVKARQVDRFARHAYAGNGRARRLGGFGVLAEARGRSRTGKRARTPYGRPSGPTPRYRSRRRRRSARRAAPRSGARRRVAGPFGLRGCPPSCHRGASPRAPGGAAVAVGALALGDRDRRLPALRPRNRELPLQRLRSGARGDARDRQRDSRGYEEALVRETQRVSDDIGGLLGSVGGLRPKFAGTPSTPLDTPSSDRRECGWTSTQGMARPPLNAR